jgi:hypothetical protein
MIVKELSRIEGAARDWCAEVREFASFVMGWSTGLTGA